MRVKTVRVAWTFCAYQYNRWRSEPGTELRSIRRVDRVSAPQLNSYSAIFRNHVVRGSDKINRGNQDGGRGAKIIQPKELSEISLLEFHLGTDYRIPFKGSFPEIFGNPNTTYREVDEGIEDALFKSMMATSQKTANKIIYLQGSIGCGKSTLLTSVLVRAWIEKDKMRHKQKKQILPPVPCIVSLEGDIAANCNCAADILKEIDKKITREVLSQLGGSAGVDLKTTLTRAAAKSRVIIIIDGADYIYTEFCKLNFEMENRLEAYHEALFNLIEQFSTGEIRDLGITIVIAMRNETLSLIANTVTQISGTNRIPLPECNIFKLTPVPEVTNVFRKRASAFLKHQDCEPIEVPDNVFEGWNDAAIHGLRHFVDRWHIALGHLPGDLFTKRLANDPSIFKIFFMAGPNQYSQVKQGISNMFLVNPHFRSAKGDIPDELVREIDRPSYWAKYWVMSELVAQQSVPRSTMNLVFEKRSGFDTRLIDLILLGLSDPAHGRIIKPEIYELDTEGKPIFGGLKSTARAQKAVERNLYFSYEYLCCVVEDYLIRFPTPLIEIFEREGGQGLQFLLEPDDKTYREKRALYVIRKAESVITFNAVLEESYKLERRRDPKLFEYFEKLKDGKFVPNFEKLNKDALRVISAQKAINFTEGERQELKLAIRAAQHPSRSGLIRSSLKAIIDEGR